MELELSLCLPVHAIDKRPYMKGGFDLNSCSITYDHNRTSCYDDDKNDDHVEFRRRVQVENDNHSLDHRMIKGRRCLSGCRTDGGGRGARGSSKVTMLFPLVSWNGDPNGDGGGGGGDWKNRSHYADFKINDGERGGIIGWPPINSWRKRLIDEHQNHQGGVRVNNEDIRVGDGNQDMVMMPNKSIFIKVKMEGVAIARKINLNHYHSYRMLTQTLIHMFSHSQGVEKYGEDFDIWYQDKQGEWQRAGELPWETFIENVQRIEVVRNNNGLQ